MHVLGRSVVIALLLVGACKRESGTPPAPKAATGEAPAAVAPPAGAPSPHGPMTTTEPGGAAPAAAAPIATVAETMNSGGYTYARLEVDGQAVWVAGPETKLAVGDKVQFVGGTLMTGFTSNTLNRTFDQIYFVPAIPPAGAAPAAPAAPAGAMAAGGAASPHTTAAPAVTEAIPPVAGGQTIAAMTAGAAGLAGKQVTVHGKVVKFNGGILGKNWVHLQDGTGDITLTTDGAAAPLTVGQVVVMRGTVALDKDFGGGYRYALIVEDATVVP